MRLRVRRLLIIPPHVVVVTIVGRRAPRAELPLDGEGAARAARGGGEAGLARVRLARPVVVSGRAGVGADCALTALARRPLGGGPARAPRARLLGGRLRVLARAPRLRLRRVQEPAAQVGRRRRRVVGEDARRVRRREDVVAERLRRRARRGGVARVERVAVRWARRRGAVGAAVRVAIRICGFRRASGLSPATIFCPSTAAGARAGAAAWGAIAEEAPHPILHAREQPERGTSSANMRVCPNRLLLRCEVLDRSLHRQARTAERQR